MFYCFFLFAGNIITKSVIFSPVRLLSCGDKALTESTARLTGAGG